MKLLVFIVFLSSALLTAQETSDAEQRLDQLKQQVIETMRKEGPASAGEVIKEYLANYSDSKALFYLAYSYFYQNKFDEAESFAIPLAVDSDPSVRAASNLLLGDIYSVSISEENDPVYFFTQALFISQENNIPKVEFRTHLSLTYWYSALSKHDLSELHLEKAVTLFNDHEFDPSDYFFAEFAHLMSLGAYRLAKKSAERMIRDSESTEYLPYYELNLAIVETVLRDFTGAKSSLKAAKEVFLSRNDQVRLEFIGVIEEAIKFCEGEKNSLQEKWLSNYSKEPNLLHGRMMVTYINTILERCK